MKTTFNRQSGSTLIVVVSIMATLMVIVGIAAEYTTNVNRMVQRTNSLESAIAIGDASIELLFNSWRTTNRGSPTQYLAASAFSPSLPTSSQFPNISGFGATATDYYGPGTANPPTVSNFKIVAADAEYNPIAGAAATPEPMFGQVAQAVTSLDPNVNPSIKTTALTLNYIASADVTLPTVKGNVVAKVRRVLQKSQLSPWNFAIFYVDPLEIHPGPLFTVTGWVHTNSDLYTGHSSLTFADKVTFASDWFSWLASNPGHGFKPGDLQHASNDPANGMPNYLANLLPTRGQALQPFGMDSTSIFSSSDANPNNDSYHELIEPPKSGYTDPLSASRYWDQAGVVIQIDASNNVLIGTPNADGTITSVMPPASGPDNRTTAQKNLYTMFSAAGTITTNQSIQDNREGGVSIRLATLDVSKILVSGQSPPAYKTTAMSPSSSFNGIVYMYDNSASSGSRRGIRLKNGSLIPPAGLTIASNNPVYLQGDFNTGGTGATVPSNDPANFNADGTYKTPASPPAPQVSGYTRAPCSILADAVNILSSAFNDGTSGTLPATPNAVPTTINTAVISGIVPTAAVGGDGSYSGGAENFPRFLENWDTKTLTYYGSMVELYQSAQSIGEWGKANVYKPPTREWFFDTNFKTKPPPGSLMIYSYSKGKWALL
jgi:hypothetical protein